MPSQVSISTQSYSNKSSTDSLGLPSDEYRILKKRQEIGRLEAHFADSSNPPSCSIPYTPFQQVGIPQESRTLISETRNATRSALGASFDFTDDSYDRSQRTGAVDMLRLVELRRERRNRKPPIPQRYLDEFNRKWAYDEEMYEPSQSIADYAYDAPWRFHTPMHTDIVPVPYRDTHGPRTRLGREYYGECEQRPAIRETPPLVSKFSFDSEIEPKRRSLFGLRSPI